MKIQLFLLNKPFLSSSYTIKAIDQSLSPLNKPFPSSYTIKTINQPPPPPNKPFNQLKASSLNNYEFSGYLDEEVNKLKRKNNNKRVKNVKKNKSDELSILIKNQKFISPISYVNNTFVKKKIKDYENIFKKDEKIKVTFYLNKDTGETIKLGVKENLKEK